MERLNINCPSDVKSEEFNVFKTLLTKEVAEMLLGLSGGNRNLDRDNVEKIKTAMLNGDYEYTTPHSGIAFDVEGKLIDGHHTLTAFINGAKENSSLKVTIQVALGCKNNTFTDRGKSRSLKDVFNMSGHQDLTAISAFAKNNVRHEKGLMITNSSKTGGKITDNMVIDHCLKNKETLETIFNAVTDFTGRNRGLLIKGSCLERSVLCSIIWRIYTELDYDLDSAIWLMCQFKSTNENGIKEIEKLRRKLNSNASKTNKQKGYIGFEDFAKSAMDIAKKIKNQIKNEKIA